MLYWWLVTNIILFYTIVSFGLATWGSYLCKVADVQEEITKQAVEEYLKEKKREEKHFMLTAGPAAQPMLMQNGANAEISAQRMMLTNGSNPYAMKPHSEELMAKYNQPAMQRQATMQQQQQMMYQNNMPMLQAQGNNMQMIQGN